MVEVNHSCHFITPSPENQGRPSRIPSATKMSPQKILSSPCLARLHSSLWKKSPYYRHLSQKTLEIRAAGHL